MKRKLATQSKLAIVFTLLAIGLWNCQEDPNGTGMELLPGSDIKTVGQDVEKESISAYTEKDMLLRTDEPNYNLFGTFNDPLFGKTTSHFATHFRLGGYPDFKDITQVDSLVLYFLYKELYGDTLTMQTLKVYELEESIFLDTTDVTGTGDYPYYQDVDLKALANPNPIGELDFYPTFRMDSTETDTLIQELAIRLDDALAQKLANADSLDMINNDVFTEFFKGLYIESQDVDNGGALLSLNTLSAGSNLRLYYTYMTDKDTANRDSVIYRVNKNSARINSFTHDYTNTPFADQLNEHPSEPDSLIYLQTTGGLRTKIDIPTLDNWEDSANIIINKAELIFQVDTVASDFRNYKIPLSVVLSAIDGSKEEGDEGYLYLPHDFTVSPALYGGFYNSEEATYNFNITHHLQKIIDEDEITNDGFYLSTLYQTERARRVVLKGSSSHVGIRLEVTYTKLK
ncbi:DUF4270 domain-containing protein [Sunxiuqinia elliptica]|uniref:DUF4270 family protein n=1 Tax=Sunxiuqinia elliptica TaxID=655355 RepID=A0A1I2AL20_9BACT|nr:DUF4270 domain-containing protein [Sunxiuqinia elliptica]SFE44417.1 protein of unknown function [Sunxiuqinia elliptica]